MSNDTRQRSLSLPFSDSSFDSSSVTVPILISDDNYKLIESEKLNWEDSEDIEIELKERLFWKDKINRNELIKRRIWMILILIIGLVGGLIIGNRSTNLLEWEWKESKKINSETCDPYSELGILIVNTTTPSENYWEPISPSPLDCKPIDFLSKIFNSSSQSEITLQEQVGSKDLDELNFLKNQTIVVFGDSVDRDHVEHICNFLSGKLETIHDKHPLSPPYSLGQEIAPEGYKNFWDGSRNWPNFDQSRPHLCTIESLQLRILNVFHYSFRESDVFIENHAHFYPPLSVSSRFTQIVIPLLENISKFHNTSSIPSLISITPGFWGLLRMVTADDNLRKELELSGHSNKEVELKLNAWSQISKSRRDEIQFRMKTTLIQILNEDKWSSNPPKVFWSK